VTLRPLRWWDLADAAAIEAEHFGADGWTEPAFWSELAQYETRRYIAADIPAGNGGIAGYAGLAGQAGEAFVQTLAVRRSCWGEGLGTSLLGALLVEAERRGAAQVLLEVRVDNVRAQALYRRFGFVEIGRRRRYYQPSGTDALVMRRG
jgi:[ribosomal protein S18]-alanine N-acetyltransferase